MSREPSKLVDVEGRDEVLLSRVRARAKSAWSASLRDDDLTRRAASEQRLTASWPRPRVLPVRSFVLGAAAAACVAAGAFMALRGELTAGHGQANVSVSASAPEAPSVSVSSLPEETTAGSSGLVVTGACPDCRIDRATVEPGVRLSSGHKLSVPGGARVTLGFAMRGALVDPAMGVDVEGPAVASVTSNANDPTIALERGTARFRGLHDVAVLIPGGRMMGNGATFTVSIDAHGLSHISVEKGRVVVTPTATATAQTLDAGAALDVPREAVPASRASGPTAVAAAAAPNGATDRSAGDGARAEEGLDAVAGARTRFHDGDVAGARAQLEGLARSRDGGVARRASFTLAEIEMASADPSGRERGRARLRELAAGPDVRLAADAATLLARSESTPTARAEAWARYLATSPPTAYRDRALLERAEALLDAGRAAEANVILADLRSAPLSDAQRRQLERLSFKARELR